MGERKYFQDQAKLGDVKEENDEELVVRAAIAREMVQDYGRYKALKPGTALDKSKRTVEVGAYLTDGHPSDHGVVTNQDEIIGEVRNPEFDEDESVLYADLAFDKARTAPKVIEEIKGEERTDVSIGFYADELMDEGRYNGKEYDRRQTNIVIDHVASLGPDSIGRCSSEEGCGILQNMDQAKAESLTLENQDDEEMRLGNFAVNDEEALSSAVDGLRAKGLSATVRECSCGDHHAHIEVDNVEVEELEDEDSRNAREIVDRNSEEPKFEWGRIYDKFGPSDMPSEEKQDNFIREGEENKDVDTMGDQDNQPDISEDELEELRNKANKADELEEKRAEELRDRLVEKYGVDEDKVEDMKVDELERFEDTLDASDLVQDEDDEDADEDDGEVVDTRTGPEGEGDDDILQHEKTNDKGLIAADTNSFTGKA